MGTKVPVCLDWWAVVWKAAGGDPETQLRQGVASSLTSKLLSDFSWGFFCLFVCLIPFHIFPSPCTSSWYFQGTICCGFSLVQHRVSTVFSAPFPGSLFSFIYHLITWPSTITSCSYRSLQLALALMSCRWCILRKSSLLWQTLCNPSGTCCPTSPCTVLSTRAALLPSCPSWPLSPAVTQSCLSPLPGSCSGIFVSFSFFLLSWRMIPSASRNSAATSLQTIWLHKCIFKRKYLTALGRMTSSPYFPNQQSINASFFVI